ncbi:MAG: hypothetical protein IJH59_04105, partial [Firmicutes bacterium]|nr:hypothetical protein [Bacillota bacterium]
MLEIRPARPEEFPAVRAFYHRLIDLMRDAPYKPGWEKGVYPADGQLRQAIDGQQLYVGELEDEYWLHREYLEAVYAYVEQLKAAEAFNRVCQVCQSALKI